jgi:hypothetical protein
MSDTSAPAAQLAAADQSARMQRRKQAKEDVLNVLKVAGQLYCGQRRFAEGAVLASAGLRLYSTLMQEVFFK